MPLLRHWSLDWIHSELLGKYVLPTGTIKTASGATNTYTFQRFFNEPGKSPNMTAIGPGQLTVTCGPVVGSERTIGFTWETTILDGDSVVKKERQYDIGQLKCNNDTVYTLKTSALWNFRSVAQKDVDPSGIEYPYTVLNETSGYVGTDGKIHRTTAGLSDLSPLETAPPVLTTNWSLLCALWKIKNGNLITQPFACSMLEDLVYTRPNQTIVKLPETEVQIGGSLNYTMLYGYRQTGEGIHPTHYWLDGQNRPLIIINSMNHCYLLEKLN